MSPSVASEDRRSHQVNDVQNERGTRIIELGVGPVPRNRYSGVWQNRQRALEGKVQDVPFEVGPYRDNASLN